MTYKSESCHLQPIKKGQELFVEYGVQFDTEGLKSTLKTALNLGHWFCGKPKKQFVEDAKPYIDVAANILKLVDKHYKVEF